MVIKKSNEPTQHLNIHRLLSLRFNRTSLEGSGEDEGDGEGGIVGPASNVFKRTLPFVQLSSGKNAYFKWVSNIVLQFVLLNIESEVWKVRISCDSCISLKSRFERTKLLAAHPFSSLLTFNSTFSSFKTKNSVFEIRNLATICKNHR